MNLGNERAHKHPHLELASSALSNRWEIRRCFEKGIGMDSEKEVDDGEDETCWWRTSVLNPVWRLAAALRHNNVGSPTIDWYCTSRRSA